MDVIYNRLKKQVEDTHGDVTFDKLGTIVVTSMEFVERGGAGDLTGPEKEAYVVEAVNRIWFDQTEKYLIAPEDKKKKKEKTGLATTQGDVEDMIRQLIQQVCRATKGATVINEDHVSIKKTMSVKKGSSFTLKRDKSVKTGFSQPSN